MAPPEPPPPRPPCPPRPPGPRPRRPARCRSWPRRCDAARLHRSLAGGRKPDIAAVSRGARRPRAGRPNHQDPPAPPIPPRPPPAEVTVPPLMDTVAPQAKDSRGLPLRLCRPIRRGPPFRRILELPAARSTRVPFLATDPEQVAPEPQLPSTPLKRPATGGSVRTLSRRQGPWRASAGV